MRFSLFALALIFVNSLASAAVKTQTIEYKDGDTTLKGILAYDDAVTDKRPGVVIVPEWWGINDYVKTRAQQIVALGYVAFVADMYGDGFVTDDPKVAGEKSGAEKQANSLARRGDLAVQQLKKSDRVDPTQIGAIGYCFGGTAVLDMARAGQELAGVVSFHGGLATDHPAQPDKVKTKILVCAGDADTLVPREQITAFNEEMTRAHAPVTIFHYPAAKHSFTNPDADKVGMPQIGYNKAADQKSWDDMKSFFTQIFSIPPAAK